MIFSAQLPTADFLFVMADFEVGGGRLHACRAVAPGRHKSRRYRCSGRLTVAVASGGSDGSSPRMWVAACLVSRSAIYFLDTTST
ncbi:hypothetical protein BKP30_27635 [Rhodococcus erythropolis]|nr:hypothetical protein BKP30_27635 [Rhodococcus erythropolis]